MKKFHLVAVLMMATAIGAFTACKQGSSQSVQTTISKDFLIKRGNYLVTTMGCNDCHSPKIMTPMGPALDTTRLLSGHRSDMSLPPANNEALKNGWALFYAEGTAMVSPMGTSYAANITSDATGIGNWSLQQFKTALTRGKAKGIETNRDLLPPMPWENYKQLSEEDITAIFTYLQSTKPVKNIVPEPQLATR